MKITIGMVFGGLSVEHEISVITALQAYHHYKNEKYELLPIYLGKDKTFYYGKALKEIKNYSHLPSLLKKCHKVQFIKNRRGNYMKVGHKKIALDAIWLVTHGNNCEDGSLYNYFNMLDFICIGMDHFQGSISQDKVLCKQILQANKIKQTKYFSIHYLQYNQNSDVVFAQAKKIGYPLIVKPAKLGSSVGITICFNDAQLIDAIEQVFQYDTKALVEEYIEEAKEFNISLLGDVDFYQNSVIEEVTKCSFLSYEDKYQNQSKNKGMAGLNRIVPAIIEEKLKHEIIQTSKKIATILESHLCVRLDFLYDTKKEILYFNEINNIPGSLAFYLWEKTDLNFSDLIDQIIDLGIRHEYHKTELTLTYPANIFSRDELDQIKMPK